MFGDLEESIRGRGDEGQQTKNAIHILQFVTGKRVSNCQGSEPVKILGEELQRVHHFKYLSSRVGRQEARQQQLHRE